MKSTSNSLRFFELAIKFNVAIIIVSFLLLVFAFGVSNQYSQRHEVTSLMTEIILDAGKAMLLGGVGFIISGVYKMVVIDAKVPLAKKGDDDDPPPSRGQAVRTQANSFDAKVREESRK